MAYQKSVSSRFTLKIEHVETELLLKVSRFRIIHPFPQTLASGVSDHFNPVFKRDRFVAGRGLEGVVLKNRQCDFAYPLTFEVIQFDRVSSVWIYEFNRVVVYI